MVRLALVAAVFAGCVAAASPAEPTAGSDTTVPLTIIPGHDALVTEAVFAPGQEIKPHRHLGLEVAYLIEGETTFQLENERGRTIRPGESVTIAAGTYHRAKAGPAGATLIICRLHPHGQPLRIPPDRPVNFPE